MMQGRSMGRSSLAPARRRQAAGGRQLEDGALIREEEERGLQRHVSTQPVLIGL